MRQRVARRQVGATLLLAALVISWIHSRGDASLAYVGPGAGFALLGSFLTLLASVFLTVCSFLFWPIRMTWGALVRRRGLRHARVRKLIFLGLDGLDPNLTERFMA